MDVVSSSGSTRTEQKRCLEDHERDDHHSSSKRKRRRIKDSKSRVATAYHEVRQDSTTLLDLPQELLTEIFALSANDAFPATCKYLYDALYANPSQNEGIHGPPMWLQKRFVLNTNPTLSFAVQKCLRRRFFGAETLKLFLPALTSTNTLGHISIPMRCVARDGTHSRELMLCAELFMNGIPLTDKSANKALVQIAAHQKRIDPESLFWRMTRGTLFTRSTLLLAFKTAASRYAFDNVTGTFHHLVKRFGIDDSVAHELYDFALESNNSSLIAALQEHGIRPDMAALTKISAMMSSA